MNVNEVTEEHRGGRRRAESENNVWVCSRRLAVCIADDTEPLLATVNIAPQCPH